MSDRNPEQPTEEDAQWVADLLVQEFDRRPDGGVAASPPALEDWSTVVRTIRRHRLEGVVAPLIRSLPAPPDIAQRVQSMHRNFAAHGLRVAHDTARVSALLAEAGIDHLVVKGVPLALVAGKHLAARGAGDVDLWVRPSDVADAERVLNTEGWSRSRDADRYPLPNDGWRWRHFLREMNEFPMVHPSASDVDMHWKLYRFDSEFGFSFDEALAAATNVRIGQASVPTLSPLHALVHMAQHGRKEAWPYLRSIVDINWIVELIDDVDIARLCTENRNVRIAIALAARLDSSLIRHVDLDRSDTRLVDDAWSRCLKAESWAVTGKQSSGWDGLRRWFDQLWWMWRSAPSWWVRLSQFRLWVQRLRSFVDPRSRPWVGRSHISVAVQAGDTDQRSSLPD